MGTSLFTMIANHNLKLKKVYDEENNMNDTKIKERNEITLILQNQIGWQMTYSQVQHIVEGSISL